MTKQEILEKLKFDMELRNRTKDTIRDYEMHVRLFQDYFDKRCRSCFADSNHLYG